MNKKPYKISKWIMLSLATISNIFIVLYSSLDSETTYKLQRPFTNFFVGLINSITKKEVKTVPLKSINIQISEDKYNDIPGYSLNEIPLGSAKEISCSFLPLDATNKSITYRAEPSNNVVLNQSGSKVSVVGMSVGATTITAKSSDGSYESSFEVNIVNTVAPSSYELSLKNSDIQLGTTQTIDFDINGGVLGHNELINFRYYDTRLLDYHSEDETVATVNEYGVITPNNTGSTKITVSNGEYKRDLTINVVSGSSPVPITSLEIFGDNICYANDMILNQSSSKYQHQLKIKDGENELDPEDFIWESSDELLAKVDKHGIMRGFRKTSTTDQTVTITARSKIFPKKTATFLVTVKNQIPNQIHFYLTLDDTKYWDKESYTLSTGDKIEVKVVLYPTTQDRAVIVSSSDTSVIKATSEGDSVMLYVLKEGKCTITITSVINPELAAKTECVVVRAGSIKTEDIKNVGSYIRKSIGHAAVFMVAQVFTLLTFYMFLHQKKWWFYSSISLCEGLFISGISELIQYFVPSRTGLLLDVIINFGGAVVGFIIAHLIVLLLKKHSHNGKVHEK